MLVQVRVEWASLHLGKLEGIVAKEEDQVTSVAVIPHRDSPTYYTKSPDDIWL